MSRETRLVLVLLAFGVLGVGGLACVADQYRKRLRAPQAPAATAKPLPERSGLRPDVVETRPAATK